MPTVVMKFGGTSVGTVERLESVADRVVRAREAGSGVIVVVSAMGTTTDDLLAMAADITDLPDPRELDMLLTAGERISMSLLGIALNARGCRAASYTGSQAGIITDTRHGAAKITEIRPKRIVEALEAGTVVILAGFQGLSSDYEITTLGRGGSDLTAVAMAGAVDADVCEIYTDVDGIFSADPRIVADARLVADITYEEMLEMAASGAKVLHLRAVEYARRYQVPLRVRSSYNEKPGSLVTGSIEEIPVEDAIITGVAHDRSEAKITILGVPDTPGMAARIFRTVADAEINIDMVLQNISRQGEGQTDITFTLPRTDAPRAVAALRAAQAEIGFGDLLADGNVGKVSLVGAGMRNHPGVTATFCEALSAVGINIETMNTSEIRISVICREEQLDDAVRALHAAFELGGDELAVVHAGTGR